MTTAPNTIQLNELQPFASYNKGYVKLGERVRALKEAQKPARPPPPPRAGTIHRILPLITRASKIDENFSIQESRTQPGLSSKKSPKIFSKKF